MLYGYIANQKWNSVRISNSSQWNVNLKKINHIEDDTDVDKLKLLTGLEKKFQ